MPSNMCPVGFFFLQKCYFPGLEARTADQPGTQGLSSAGDRHRKPENGLTNWIAHILRGIFVGMP